MFQLALFSMASMTTLGATIIAPSLPSMQEHFKDIADIEVLVKLILTLPALFVMLMAPIAGILLDRFGRLKFIIPSMIIWSFSGITGFFVDNFYLILISRAIFGMATAFIMNGASVLIGDYFHGGAMEKALSKQGFFVAFGGGIFLILSGYLSHISWRAPFLVYALGFLILILVVFNLVEPSRDNRSKKIDSNIKEKFNFLKIIHICGLGFLIMICFYIIPTQIPFFITHKLHQSGDLIGLSLGLGSFSMAITSLFYFRIRQALGIFKAYFVGLFLFGLGFLLIRLFHNYIVLLFAMAIIGFGFGIVIVNNSSYLFLKTSLAHRAKAFGILTSLLFMGQFLSPFYGQGLINLKDIDFMFSINAAILMLIALAFLLISFLNKGVKTA